MTAEEAWAAFAAKAMEKFTFRDPTPGVEQGGEERTREQIEAASRAAARIADAMLEEWRRRFGDDSPYRRIT